MRDPIFIIGTERSGSNLIRLILNAHSRIAVPHPPHILHYFSPLAASYGDLNREANLRRLVRDVLRLLDTHIYPWEVEIDTEAVIRDARPRTLLGIMAAIYDQYLAWSGKARWGCKSTFMIHHTDTVLRSFPGGKLIWLVRDPRDVAVSSRKAVFSPFHPYYTALLWQDQQRIGLDLEAKLPKRSLMRVRYEDLLARPEETVRTMCAFLGEAFEQEMLRFYETPSARKSSTLSASWGNTDGPILATNRGRYKAELTEQEVRIVEGVAHEPMTRLGYEAQYRASSWSAPSMGRRLSFRIQNEGAHLAIELRSLRGDRNHWRRWNRALRLKRIRWECRLRAVAALAASTEGLFSR